ELTNVAERMTRRQYMPGEIIIREGEVGEELFLISEGEVEVDREGREVARLGPGDFFGELALMSGNPRNANVIATRPVDTYVLGKDDFDAAFQASSSFREQLRRDRKSTRLNSSHLGISYAVFCLKKKNNS